MLREVFDYVITKDRMTWFDTADSYGTGSLTGRSEQLLGQFLTEQQLQLQSRAKPGGSLLSLRRSSDLHLQRQNINFCTKIAPFPWRIGKQCMTDCFRASQRRLQRDPVDMVQLHWAPSYGWQENAYLEAFCDVVKNGEAKQIGLSNYGPVGLKRAKAFVQERGCDVYSNQVRFRGSIRHAYRSV